MKNPFVPGDVIWFESRGEPQVVFVMSHSVSTPETPFRRVDHQGKVDGYSLEEVLDFRKYRLSGPYRLDQAENWSGYDFTEGDDG